MHCGSVLFKYVHTVSAARTVLVPSGSRAEKCERISGFAGSLAENANVSACSLVPSRKALMHYRVRWFPHEKCGCISVSTGSLAKTCACISVFAGSLTESANISTISLDPSRKVQLYQRFRWFPHEKCKCIIVFAGSLTKSAKVSSLSPGPSRKIRMCQRLFDGGGWG